MHISYKARVRRKTTLAIMILSFLLVLEFLIKLLLTSFKNKLAQETKGERDICMHTHAYIHIYTSKYTYIHMYIL